MATKIAPMLGAIVTSPPKSQGKKRAKKSKGEKSVTQPGQQHGELLNYKAPTDRQMIKESAKHTMRHATESWVRGDMSTREHEQVHARAKHVMSGRKPREF
jgi:hypothetical protein